MVLNTFNSPALISPSIATSFAINKTSPASHYPKILYPVTHNQLGILARMSYASAL